MLTRRAPCLYCNVSALIESGPVVLVVLPFVGCASGLFSDGWLLAVVPEAEELLAATPEIEGLFVVNPEVKELPEVTAFVFNRRLHACLNLADVELREIDIMPIMPPF